MYRKSQAFEQLCCTKSEFESILKKLQMNGKNDFTKADVDRIQINLEQKRKKEKMYTFIIILVALILVGIVFIAFNLALGKLGG